MTNKTDVLVIYFSVMGNTKRAAEEIARKTGADVIKLNPEVPYPSDYSALTAVAKKQLDQHELPALANQKIDLAAYNVVFIGYPAWWAQPPMLFHTFFKSVVFTGQEVIPFMTSVSSKVEESVPVLEKLLQGDTELLAGLTANSPKQIDAFLKAEGLVRK